MLSIPNNFMEAFNNFPILFSYIYQGNQYLFQNIRNIYPQQIQQIMTMYQSNFSQNPPMMPQQPLPSPQNPYTCNLGQPQINSATGQKDLIPRGNTTVNYNAVTNPNQCVINLSFNASTGNKVLLAVNGDISIEELLKIYVRRLNLPETVIKKDVMFSYNGEQIQENSKELVMNHFRNGDLIQVYDINNIIGA